MTEKLFFYKVRWLKYEEEIEMAYFPTALVDLQNTNTDLKKQLNELSSVKELLGSSIAEISKSNNDETQHANQIAKLQETQKKIETVRLGFEVANAQLEKVFEMLVDAKGQIERSFDKVGDTLCELKNSEDQLKTNLVSFRNDIQPAEPTAMKFRIDQLDIQRRMQELDLIHANLSKSLEKLAGLHR